MTDDREQQQTDTLAGENRAGTTAEEIAVSFRNHVTHSVGRPLESSSLIDKYHALSAAVRDRLMDQWLETIETYRQKDVRVLAYLSAEYLLGPHLGNALVNLGILGFAGAVGWFYFSDIYNDHERALGLIGLGVLFLAGGWALEKMRRRILARMASTSQLDAGMEGGAQ